MIAQLVGFPYWRFAWGRPLNSRMEYRPVRLSNCMGSQTTCLVPFNNNNVVVSQMSGHGHILTISQHIWRNSTKDLDEREGGGKKSFTEQMSSSFHESGPGLPFLSTKCYLIKTIFSAQTSQISCHLLSLACQQSLWNWSATSHQPGNGVLCSFPGFVCEQEILRSVAQLQRKRPSK